MPVLSGPGSGIPIARDENRDKARSDGVFPRCPGDIAMTLDGDFLVSM